MRVEDLSGLSIPPLRPAAQAEAPRPVDPLAITADPEAPVAPTPAPSREASGGTSYVMAGAGARDAIPGARPARPEPAPPAASEDRPPAPDDGGRPARPPVQTVRPKVTTATVSAVERRSPWRLVAGLMVLALGGGGAWIYAVHSEWLPGGRGSATGAPERGVASARSAGAAAEGAPAGSDGQASPGASSTAEGGGADAPGGEVTGEAVGTEVVAGRGSEAGEGVAAPGDSEAVGPEGEDEGALEGSGEQAGVPTGEEAGAAAAAPGPAPGAGAEAPEAAAGEKAAAAAVAPGPGGARKGERAAAAHRGRGRSRRHRPGKTRQRQETLASANKGLPRDSEPASGKDGAGVAAAGKSAAGASKNEGTRTMAEAAAPSPKDQARDHVRAGNSFARQGKWKAAAAEYEKAVLLDDRNALAHRGLGVAYAGMKRAKEAIREYELYLKLAPKARDAGQVKAIIDAYYAKQK